MFFHEEYEKYKAVPVHAMKAYRTDVGTAPLILNHDNRRMCVGEISPREAYLGEKPRNALNRRLYCFKAGMDIFKNRKILSPSQDSNPDCRGWLCTRFSR